MKKAVVFASLIVVLMAIGATRPKPEAPAKAPIAEAPPAPPAKPVDPNEIPITPGMLVEFRDLVLGCASSTVADKVRVAAKSGDMSSMLPLKRAGLIWEIKAGQRGRVEQNGLTTLLVYVYESGTAGKGKAAWVRTLDAWPVVK